MHLAVIMVGLPARGKTYIARKTARYLAWLGYVTRIFNVGNYRRDTFGAAVPHEFFDPGNEEYTRKRAEVALNAMDDMLRWFGIGVDEGDKEHTELQPRDSDRNDPGSLPQDTSGKKPPLSPFHESNLKKSKPVVFHGLGIATSTSDLRARATVPGEGAHGGVAVYDATNSTKERRSAIIEKLRKNGIQIMFVESICDNEEVVMSNIREVKISSPDYVGVNPDLAAMDFMQRIKHYEQGYQPITAEENNGDMPFVKLVNVGSQVIVNHIRGYLQSRIVYFLMNLNITPRHIYFSRHGESMYNVEGKIGGDSDLSPRGRIFSRKLPELMEQQISHNKDTQLTVWTSTLRRTAQTAENLKYQKIKWKILDEIDAGVCDGYTYEEINRMFPNDYIQRDSDKYNYRRRIISGHEPVIMELERHHETGHSILIIGHQAVLRCIYAYYLNYSHEELPFLKIPLHTVVKITPKAYGCIEERFTVDVPAVNTHRERGASPVSSPTIPHTWPMPELSLTRQSPSLPQLSSVATASSTPNSNSTGINNIMPKRSSSPLRNVNMNSPRIGNLVGITRRISITATPTGSTVSVGIPHVVATEEVMHSSEDDLENGGEEDEKELADELGDGPGPAPLLLNLSSDVPRQVIDWEDFAERIVNIDDEISNLGNLSLGRGSSTKKTPVPFLKQAPPSRTASRQNSVAVLNELEDVEQSKV
ncbi:Fructose-2,6-bisphosphatase [Nowakowskiella sp. JEL0078]|nr:Fructose-2,6-bisphosphatase [Nowakowskiella sp. JEL0078]